MGVKWIQHFVGDKFRTFEHGSPKAPAFTNALLSGYMIHDPDPFDPGINTIDYLSNRARELITVPIG